MRKRDGFTLVEILLALVLASIVLSIIYGIFISTLKSKRYSEEVKNTYKLGQAIMNLVTRDLKGLRIISPRARSLEEINNEISGSKADSINFISTSEPSCLQDGKKSDINEVGYITMMNAEKEGLIKLYRREDFFVDEDIFQGGNHKLLSDEVRSFDLEYFDGMGWQESWDSNEIPKSIRVTLVIEKEHYSERSRENIKKEYIFSSVINIPVAN